MEAGSESALVRLEVADGVATVTLDSPKNRNALSRRLLTELNAAIDVATADPGVRVLVLTAAGPVFCSGADLREQRERLTPQARGSALAALPEILMKLWDCRQPVVCRMNGLARAGGIGLLAACDLVVAPASVTFSFTEVRIGVVPALISVVLLRRMAPQAVHRLFLTGEEFDAAQARELGLVDVVADEGALDAAVERVVAMLMRGGPEALALTKPLAHNIGSLPAGEAFARMSQLSAERFASTEGQEGMRAFAEKRDPEWVPAAYRSS